MASEVEEEEFTSGVEDKSTWTDLLELADLVFILGAILLLAIGEYLAAAVLLLLSIRIALRSRT